MRLVAVLACSILVWGDERADLPIVELARSAPPEFFADAVLRLVESGKISKRDQADLLKDAFAAAAQAKEPVRLIAVPGTPPDTRELYRSKAGEVGLDALSLQSRIVIEMAARDSGKARELFEAITRPAFDPRPCGDALVADASAYYDAAAAIARSFTGREKESELHVQFLSALLVTARPPNEIAAFARAMQTVDLTPDQLRFLLSAIAAKLELTAAEYRPFAMSLDALQMELGKMIEANRAARAEMVRSFRTYVKNQLNAPRCAPDLSLGLDQIVWLQPPVTEDEIRPATPGESFKTQSYFHGEGAARIGEGLNRLRAGAGTNLADFLHDFDAWTPEGSDVDAFHQRATVLRALLQIVPGADRAKILNRAAAFLEKSDAERKSPAEWLWEARDFLNMAGADRVKLAAAFRASSNVSLALYSGLGYFGDSSGTSK